VKHHQKEQGKIGSHSLQGMVLQKVSMRLLIEEKQAQF
jgi:hypothetical protein